MQLQEPSNLIPLGEATDVWGIGRIAWQLIVNRHTAYGPVRDKRASEPNDFDRFIPLSLSDARNRVRNNMTTTLTGGKHFPAAANYSNELRNLVRACLNFNVEDRPTLEEIYGAATEDLERNEAAGMDVVMDPDGVGLGLKLPDMEEFEIGGEFDGRKYRSGESEDSEDV